MHHLALDQQYLNESLLGAGCEYAYDVSHKNGYLFIQEEEDDFHQTHQKQLFRLDLNCLQWQIIDITRYDNSSNIPVNNAQGKTCVVSEVNSETFVIFLGGRFGNTCFYVVNVTAGVAHQTFYSLPIDLKWHSSVITNLNKIIIFGGVISSMRISNGLSMYCFNPEHESEHMVLFEKQLRSENDPYSTTQFILSLFGHSAVLKDNTTKMVVFGGCTFHNQCVNQLMYYDLTREKWFMIEPSSAHSKHVPSPRYGHRALMFENYGASGQMLISGGIVDQVSQNDFWFYDFGKSYWTEINVDTSLYPFTYSPNTYAFHCMAYSASYDAIVVVGGGTYLPDVHSGAEVFYGRTNPSIKLDQVLVFRIISNETNQLFIRLKELAKNCAYYHDIEFICQR